MTQIHRARRSLLHFSSSSNSVCLSFTMIVSNLELVNKSTKLKHGIHPAACGAVYVDSCWSWLVMFSSFWCQTVLGGFLFSSVHVLADVAKEFNATMTEVSVVTSLLAGCSMLIGPIVGAFSRQFGFRIVAIIGSALLATGICLSQFVPSVAVLYVTHGVISGMGSGMIYVPSTVIVSFYFVRWRTLAVCFSICGTSAGGLIFEQLYKYTTTTYGWRFTLWIETGLALSCAVAALSYRPLALETPSPSSSAVSLHDSMTQLKTSLAKVKQEHAKFFDFSLLRSPVMLLLMLSGSLTMLVTLVPFTYLLDYSKHAGIDVGTYQYSIMIISLASLVGRVMCGILGSWKRCPPLWLSCVTIIVGGLALASISLSKSIAYQFICYILFGVATASFFALRPIIVGELMGISRLTESFGLLMFAQGISVIGGPPLAGYLKEITGSYDSMFYYAGGVLALSGLVLIPLPFVNRYVNRKRLAWTQQVNSAMQAATQQTSQSAASTAGPSQKKGPSIAPKDTV